MQQYPYETQLINLFLGLLLDGQKVLKTLKDASLQKLSQLLKKKQNFESLGLPETLKNDLLNEAQNIWYQEQLSRTTFPDMKLRRERDRPWRAFQYLI